MTANTTPIPEPNEIRAIARAYALECQQGDIKPSLRGICSRFNRHNCWLTTSPLTANARLVRSIIVMEWRTMGVPLTAAQIGLDPQPPHWQGPKPAPRPELATEAEGIPAEYLEGDALHEVLQHPGRLRQFCNLVDTAGLAGAFRYAQVVRDFYKANAKPQGAA